MPRYSVGFTVHEAVFSSLSSRTPIDPLVVVRCFENEFVTSVKQKKTIVACWDESYQWNNMELSQKAWNSGVIEFELQSANTFWRNDTLGQSVLQLKLISTYKNNKFSGEIPITAPNSVRIIGYLTVTVNAYDLSHETLKNTQPSVTKELELKEETHMEVPPLTSPLVYRSAVPMEVSKVYKYFHLYINVYSLEDIETEPFGFSPHITCEYAGCRLESAKPIKLKGIGNERERSEEGRPKGEVIEHTSSIDLLSEKISSYMENKTNLLTYNTEVRRSNYTYNQCFLIPISVAVGEPTLEDNIILRIWKGYSVELPSFFSKNATNRGVINSKLLAEGVFSLARLRSSKQKARWFNFYKSTEEDFITSMLGPSEEPELENERKNTKSVNSGINEIYAGRVLMSASIKRINKVSDVLKAHVVSSHQLEPMSPSPTRIFCDVFSIESSNNFTFSEPFEIALELSCGPYKNSTNWQKVTYRRESVSGLKRDLDFLGQNMKAFMNEEYFGSNDYSASDYEGKGCTGWMCSFDSVQGRLNPMDLLVAYNKEEQWFIFVKVLARKEGDKNVYVLGSSKFTFEDLASYKPNTVKVPVWVSLTTAKQNVSDNIIRSTINLISGLEKTTKELTRTSSMSTADTVDYSSKVDSVGKMTTNASFLNVLVSLEKEMFYSSYLESSTNKQFRVTSHSRRTSMVMMDYELRCYIYTAKMDRIYSNLSVSVVCEGKKKTTSSRRKQSLFPVFMECLSMPISMHTPVNNVVPNVPILVTLNNTEKEENYIYSDQNDEGNQSKGQKVTKKKVKVNVTNVLYSAVVTYNRLITSAKGHDNKGGVPKWLKIGKCKLLLFVDVVAKSEAKSVPKFQMLPTVHNVTVKLGLFGLRNLKYNLENEEKPKGVKGEDNLVLKVSVQNYGICTDDEQFYEVMCNSEFASTWESDGKKNFDLFTVETFQFLIPEGLIFDPHLEVKIAAENSRRILGYCCLPIYKNNKSLEKYNYLEDLRLSLVPRKMCETFENIQKKGNKGSYQLLESLEGNSGTMDNGVPEILREFQATKEFKKMVKSLKFENTSVSVPPKFLVVTDGRKVVNSNSLSYNMVSDSNIDEILTDVPYNIQYLLAHRDPAGTADEFDKESEMYTNNQLLGSQSTNDYENEMGIMKYFLTISDDTGYNYTSYDNRYKDISVESNKMFRVFRTSLKASLFKIRVSLLSSSSFPSKPGSTTYLSLEIASREKREPLSQTGGLMTPINKSYEREIFLPEHSQIVLRATESYSTFTGDTLETLIGVGYVDLENRWFSKTWQSMQRTDSVPIERIVLYHKGHVQGHVNLLIQLAKIEKFPLLKTINLTQTPMSSVEIRIVIWSVRDAKTPTSEAKKDMLDLYVSSRLDCQTYSGSHEPDQKTDIHYNCDSGNASFNWRVVYPEVKTPLGACHLQLSLYDFWKIGSPTFLGDVNLELKKYVNNVSTTGNKVKVDGELPLYASAKSTPSGFIHLTLHVLTQSEANSASVGLGRDEPNRDPYLLVPNAGRQWQDWLAHTGFSIDFSGYTLYFRVVGCFLLLVWLIVISFIYPAILL